MALVGSLRDLSLPELLAIIANGEKSGVITIRSDAATAQIHLNRGKIVRASDTLRDERFGEIMLKLGKISQETLAAALRAQETAGGSRRLGAILVDMGAITGADQSGAVLYQTATSSSTHRRRRRRPGSRFRSTRSSRRWIAERRPASARESSRCATCPTLLSAGDAS